MTGEAATCDSCDTHPHLSSMVSHAAAAPPPAPASMVSHSVTETEASATVELVSDDEDAEDYGEAAGVVYSCTLGDNQPLVIQAVTSDEAEIMTASKDGTCIIWGLQKCALLDCCCLELQRVAEYRIVFTFQRGSNSETATDHRCDFIHRARVVPPLGESDHHPVH